MSQSTPGRKALAHFKIPQPRPASPVHDLPGQNNWAWWAACQAVAMDSASQSTSTEVAGAVTLVTGGLLGGEQRAEVVAEGKEVVQFQEFEGRAG